MPITTITGPYGQHVVGNTKLLIPVIDKQGQLVSVVDGAVGVSYPFVVGDEPMTLVASNFQDHPSDILQVQVSPEGLTWQDLWLHGTAIQLTPHNSLIHISVPGTYRLARPGWFVLPPDIAPPSNPLQKSTASGWYGTLTHEPALGMIPEVGSIGPQGEVGPQGVPGAPGEPPTALFIIAPTAPDVNQYPHGAAWWDLDNGRAFILYDDGTSKQWVEFIGSPGVASFIMAPVAPPVYSYVPGAAWWDTDNGRVFILYDDGTSRQWVEFIGSPSPGGGGTEGPQGPQGDVGPQGAVGAQGVAGPTHLPPNAQSANYTTVLADAGGMVNHPSTDANARTYTIDGSVAYPVGTTLTFTNRTSQVASIVATTDVLTLAGPGTTGTRSLAQNGVATALKDAPGQWLISGTGLT